ncbi:MAG: LysM peptidoglycan-binding domain-containing protein [Pseudomonadota bacterium]
MKTHARLLALVVCLLAARGNAAETGTVTLPLSRYQTMIDQVEKLGEKPQPPVAVAAQSRLVEGRFRKGLFSATLEARFVVLADKGHVRVPVLDSSAAIQDVTLDGVRTSLQREGSLYTVGVDRAGPHLLRARFLWGQEQDRFARRLRFSLPAAGASEVRVQVPETDIEAELGQGALDPPRRLDGNTQLVAHLDAQGLFDLGWRRKAMHREDISVRSEARLSVLYTVGEALITGLCAMDIDVLEGETDRLELRVPEGVEVVSVEGPAVLQWHGDPDKPGQLSVLLRYLVDRRTRIAVRFQYPVEDVTKPVALRTPLPAEGVPLSGHLGVLAAAGLQVETASVQKATEQTLRDLPAELTELTQSPLLFGYAFGEPPELAITLSRLAEVALTTTVVDELQASSVLNEDGAEITKLKLRVRNNTRQYLRVTLPAGALLTHALIDGTPVRPALGGQDGQAEVLLLPLRQSERLAQGKSRQHQVQLGETLSDIANFYFGSPGSWERIVEANPDQLGGPHDIYEGQRLRVPLAAGNAVEESSFVVELAYSLGHPPLGALGRCSLQLPALDVDTVSVLWHLYLPRALSPLRFDGNLSQYSAIRYDPFRRVQQFLQRAMWVKNAWAGERYQSILLQRKSIWQIENRHKGSSRGVLAAFPLVGERYRFKRLLPGAAQPQLGVTYIANRGLPAVRWLALGLALALVLWVLGRPRERGRWVVLGLGALLLLVLGHYVLGVHRRVLWGVDLALLITWVRWRGPSLWRGLWASLATPWTWWQALRLRTVLASFGWLLLLLFVVSMPLLLSSVALLLLLVLVWRARPAGEEVRHA